MDGFLSIPAPRYSAVNLDDRGTERVGDSDKQNQPQPPQPQRMANCRSLDPSASPISTRFLRPPPSIAPVVVGVSLERVWFVRMLPIIAGSAWLIMLSALLLIWAFVDDYKRYKPDSSSVTHLSYVGGEHPALFLAGCITTSLGWFGAYAIERILRYEHLALSAETTEVHHKTWMIVGWVDLGLVSLGSGSLIFIATFICFSSSTALDLFSGLFALSLILSGLLQTLELRLVFHSHRAFRSLHRNMLFKAVTLLLTLVFLSIFEFLDMACPDARVSLVCWEAGKASAVAEWMGCYVGGLYLISLSADLWPVERYEHSTSAVVRRAEGDDDEVERLNEWRVRLEGGEPGKQAEVNCS